MMHVCPAAGIGPPLLTILARVEVLNVAADHRHLPSKPTPAEQKQVAVTQPEIQCEHRHTWCPTRPKVAILRRPFRARYGGGRNSIFVAPHPCCWPRRRHRRSVVATVKIEFGNATDVRR